MNIKADLYTYEICFLSFRFLFLLGSLNRSIHSLLSSAISNILNAKFEVVDATELVAWWKSSSYKDFKNPLVLCCNNTMNIIPQSIRYRVIQEMRELCGTKNSGRVLVSYWNGNYFSHGVANFYLKNPALCGEVDVHNDIDWKNNSMMTKTGYFTQWQKPDWVMRLLKCYDIDPVYSRSLIQEDCLITEGLGIFVWFTARTSGARDLYDSDDAQLLYSQVWGSGTMHLGRYEQVLNCPSPGKLPSDPNVLSSSIINAQQLHEDDFCAAVRAKTEHCEGVPIPCRVLDMGCTYGHLDTVAYIRLFLLDQYFHRASFWLSMLDH